MSDFLFQYLGPLMIDACYVNHECGGEKISLTSNESAVAQVRECCIDTPALSYTLLGQCINCVGKYRKICMYAYIDKFIYY